MPEGSEDVLRQLLAGVAGLEARVEEMGQRIEATADDARQARDLGNRIAARLEEQNIVARMTELRGELNAKVAALRQDVVLANQNLRKELIAVERRLDVLEEARSRVIGVTAFFSYLSRVAPWLAAGVAAFLAGLGFRGDGQ